MSKKMRDLEENLFQYTKKSISKQKSRTLEDALEEALELKPKEEDVTNEGEWI